MSDDQLELALVTVELDPTAERLEELRQLVERVHALGIPMGLIDVLGAARTLVQGVD